MTITQISKMFLFINYDNNGQYKFSYFGHGSLSVVAVLLCQPRSSLVHGIVYFRMISVEYDELYMRQL